MRMIAGLAPWALPCLVGWVVSVQGAGPAWAAAIVEPPEWKEAPAVAALFQRAGVTGTFVLLEEGTGVLHGFNPGRAAQRFTPASTFKIPNTLIGLSLGAVKSVDERIPYTGAPNPWIREWLEPMGLRGAIRVSNVPIYQELARRIGLAPMGEALRRLNYGNEKIGPDVTTFWLRGPLAISAIEQTRFLSRLAHQRCPFPWKLRPRWPRSPGWMGGRAGASMPKPAGRTALGQVWAGGWAGCSRDRASLPSP